MRPCDPVGAVDERRAPVGQPGKHAILVHGSWGFGSMRDAPYWFARVSSESLVPVSRAYRFFAADELSVTHAPTMEETKIIYHMDDEETPYLVKLNISPERVTLADFKNVLNRPNYKYFFKSMDDDFG